MALAETCCWHHPLRRTRRAQLNEEQLRASKLRSELASLSSSRMKEQQEKGGLLSDTLSRLQVGE